MNHPPPSILAPELIWQPDGHLSDVAIDALSADEDAVLPTSAGTHAAQCAHCTLRVAEGSLALVLLRERLQAHRSLLPVCEASPVQSTRAGALAVAMGIACGALGALPTVLADGPSLAASGLEFLENDAPALFWAGVQLADHGFAGAGPWVTAFAATLSLALAALIAMPRRLHTSNGANV